jgi:hypothetical protein
MVKSINQNMYDQNKIYKKVMCWAEQCIVIRFSAAIEKLMVNTYQQVKWQKLDVVAEGIMRKKIIFRL